MRVALILLVLLTCHAYAEENLRADPKTMFYTTHQNVLGLGVPETDLRLCQNLGLMFVHHKRLLANKLSFLAQFNLDFPMREYRQWLEKMSTPVENICSTMKDNETDICVYHKANLKSIEQMQQTKIQRSLETWTLLRT